MQVYDPNINYCSSKSNEYRQFKKINFSFSWPMHYFPVR